MKGIEEFKQGLGTINEVKNAVTTLSDDLKELRESVRVSGHPLVRDIGASRLYLRSIGI